MLVQDINIGPVIIQLLEQYGLTGILFGVLLGLMIKQAKRHEERIAQLEKDKDQQQENILQIHKNMIAEYVELIKNKTKVLYDLTGALNAIKETLDRLERRQE